MDVSNIFQTKFGDPTISIYLSPDFGARNLEYRKLLRQRLFETLKDLGDTQTPYSNVLSLENPPSSNIFGISVAHTLELGGFAISKKYLPIGFDIENINRPTEKAAARVSSEDQIKGAPSPLYLWVALEASFKALSRVLPIKLLSQIEISEWEVQDHHAYCFKSRHINGLVQIREQHILALAVAVT